jgi:hypothetical protein
LGGDEVIMRVGTACKGRYFAVGRGMVRWERVGGMRKRTRDVLMVVVISLWGDAELRGG